ncbi:MAG: hypothetical protein V4616_13885 [Bacteroidota bacterium]
MKRHFIIAVLLLQVVAASAQELYYEVRETTSRTVTRETLAKSKLIGDFTPGYPRSWINDYLSTEITVTSNGKKQKASGYAERLSVSQLNLISSADLNSEVVVTVSYRRLNEVSQKQETRDVHYKLTVVPEIEAQYPGGLKVLSAFLKKKTETRIDTAKSIGFKGAVIKFTIDEAGNLSDPHFTLSSSDVKLDGFLMETLKSAPKWKPAQTAKGEKVKQEFEFSVGPGGC